ncbi:hypothetical protein [Sphingobacterium kyonggiense]
MKNKQEQMVRGRVDNGLPSQEILDHYQSQAKSLAKHLNIEEEEHYIREALKE